MKTASKNVLRAWSVGERWVRICRCSSISGYDTEACAYGVHYRARSDSAGSRVNAGSAGDFRGESRLSRAA